MAGQAVAPRKEHPVTRNLLTNAGLIIAPAVAAAGIIIGGAIAFAQEGDDGSPTPSPQEQATPDATPKNHDGHDCPNKGGDGSDQQGTSANSGV